MTLSCLFRIQANFSTADIKSISVVVMEVPCCQGLPVIVESGMEKAGKKIPMEKVIISVKGDLLGKEQIAASVLRSYTAFNINIMRALRISYN